MSCIAIALILQPPRRLRTGGRGARDFAYKKITKAPESATTGGVAGGIAAGVITDEGPSEAMLEHRADRDVDDEPGRFGGPGVSGIIDRCDFSSS
jgi:hypothetical protein